MSLFLPSAHLLAIREYLGTSALVLLKPLPPHSSTGDSPSWAGPGHGMEAPPSETCCLLNNLTPATSQDPSTNLLPPRVAPIHIQDLLPHSPSGVILGLNGILSKLPSLLPSFTFPQRDPFLTSIGPPLTPTHQTHTGPQASAEGPTHRMPGPADFLAGAVSGAPLLREEDGAGSVQRPPRWLRSRS